MSSNPSPLPPVSPSSSSPLLSTATARLPVSIEKARAVIDSNLALLRAILRDPATSITASDGRFVSARDSLRALHLELEDRWFDSQLEAGNGSTAAAAVKPPRAARVPRGPRKVSAAALGSGALGSSPLSDLASTLTDIDPQSAATPGRSSLLAIAGIPVSVSPPLTPAAPDPLGADDIPEMPVASGIGALPTLTTNREMRG